METHTKHSDVVTTGPVSAAIKIIHHKEVHSFYMFTTLIVIGILILQPITMLLVMIMQTMLQN